MAKPAKTKEDVSSFQVPRGMDLIGSVETGRPTLGTKAPVAIFRALRLVGMMEGLDGTLGKDGSALVYNSGKHFGYHMGQQVIAETGRDLGRYVQTLQKKLEEMGVGLLSVPELKLEEDFLKVRVDECITCAGMPNIGKAVCHFESGYVSGLLEVFLASGKKCQVKEMKCWGLGDRTCEFDVKIA